ncbi:DUF4148 domain-containing protein [Burkholderia pseudomultivorans]|uniref:Purine nucleoside phosphorylase n=1 Tax=Burkholderia pseudomultivorans TaxID=1207504 RepID=A0A132ESI2_9BURK|nr:DUF4148 domain-containing protein [Burkholderia pseudomultivorans]KWF09090.1 hypothetical protein WT55_18125 [Burkholderia pseudomultivorans]KWF58013.1 hypothetical protein WT57_30805 [Burkholderia pseudomultivorans]KWI52675.1 hypothetical protein WT72_20520 [Burkholderia pseudomultivorans]MBF5010394.1 DUF4148 domain-containing protein [Burkholderia pseudomultivorans]
MKIIAAFVFATLSLPFGASAFAQSAQAPLTRAEVRQQLIEAQADGLLPSNRNDYPPSPDEIAHNRARYAAEHAGAMPTATASSDAAPDRTTSSQ